MFVEIRSRFPDKWITHVESEGAHRLARRAEDNVRELGQHVASMQLVMLCMRPVSRCKGC
jgi:hypothetical protein